MSDATTATTTRKRVWFTFGNHMHWVDMQWLWGYQVLPDSVRDMLRLCRETGARGNVNFDGVGYEKMAAECPEALAELREAIREGFIEPVGGSWGEPYGLFQGGESNVRQFTYALRSIRRLLGVRTRSFWEEEFYFFPQLPQMLRSCGFTGANLFFQWTWHTPEIPREPHSLILWEGIDGSRVPALPRNELNLHQWPEDFAPLSDSSLLHDLDRPAIVQWLELMPTQDWMCRSEVLLPKLTELLNNPEMDVVPGTMSEVIAALFSGGRHEGGGRDEVEESEQASASPRPVTAELDFPVRHYTMDDVWHGITLGKNADRHPRTSRETERLILAAESAASISSLFGRPYSSWNVYPTWELDEAWRELLAAQHHDNHECEGLCGFVGYQQMARARLMAMEVGERTFRHIEDRAGAAIASNPLGFSRTITVGAGEEARRITVPPFGYRDPASGEAPTDTVAIERDGERIMLRRGEFAVEIDGAHGLITQIRSAEFPNGVLARDQPLLQLAMQVDGKPWRRPAVDEVDIDDKTNEVTLWLAADQVRTDRYGSRFARAVANAADLPVALHPSITIRIADAVDAVDVRVRGLDLFPRPDAGFKGALRLPVAMDFSIDEIRCDTPYAVEAVKGGGRVRRKYPTGDWMTSPQWFEEVEGSIVAYSFLDLVGSNGAGLLIAHDGSQQVFRRDHDRFEFILNAYCPWDEVRYELEDQAEAGFRIMPHASSLTDADRVRQSMMHGADAGLESLPADEMQPETHAGAVGGGGAAEPGTAPKVFGALSIENAPGVIAMAFHRESMKSGEHFPDWAGHRMYRESNGDCDHPFVIRLVEYNDDEAEVLLKLPGEVAMAAKVNLMGEVGEDGRHEGTEARRHEREGEKRGAASPRSVPSNSEALADTKWLDIEYPAAPPEWANDLDEPIMINGEELKWSVVRFTMRPREIATVMADLVLGRKQWRNLDEMRKVWATVHRT